MKTVEHGRMYRVQKYKIFYVKETGVPVESRQISHKRDVQEFALKQLQEHPFESVLIVALDSRNKIIGYTRTEGTVNQCAVYPREVFSFLFSCGAAAFIMVHNHPGGGTNPSEADWALTKKLKNAGDGLDIPMHDHLIVSDDQCVSFREMVRWGER